ncbi:urease accessory protein UreF [Cohaesibacter intestini]|uniref:urease accessory protein UreF n=1 Tax=Cohaesibacter intestini TaxID=2211145 RepID=UPI000DE90C41|nr:urease accessory protein UreF [Cohaesibacter intestini]
MLIEAKHDQKPARLPQGVALLRLLTWLSPAFPIGAFSYSHGLETAIAKGNIHDRDSMQDWLLNLIARGSCWSDAVLLAQAWRCGTDSLQELLSLNEFALALAPSAERFTETSQLGDAFYKASKAWPTTLHDTLNQQRAGPIAQPVIVGAIARAHTIPLEVILPSASHAFLSNLISVAIRLVPLGQTDGLALQAALEDPILHMSERAAQASLEDIGTACLLSDIAAMQHETLTTRIFRS